MCGLIGYSGKDNYNLDKIKFLMLWNSIERGKDATGIYTPSSGLLKDNDPAGRFFYLNEIKKLVDDNQLIAHVRAKTIGVNSAKNAHPFDYSDIVLAHNGTLVDYHALATKYGMKINDWDVDSQVLGFGVNRAFGEGVTLDNINVETFSEYKGAAAILFYSKRLDMIFVFKDKERPLYCGYDQNKNMYISSTDEPMKALGFTDIKAFADKTLYAIHKGEIIKKQEYKLYSDLHKAEYHGKVRGREKGQRFPKLKKGVKGIKVEVGENSSFKAYWFLDLWLRATTQTWTGPRGEYDKLAVLKKDRYYRVTGFYGDKINIVQVRDEDGNLGQANLACFDTDNCIPQEGDLYKLTVGITSTKDKIDLWNKGDYAEVTSIGYSMEWGTVNLWHDSSNRGYNIDTKNCKPCTQQETLDYWSEISDEDTPVDTLPETPLVDGEGNSPFIDNSSEDNKLADFIDTKAFIGVLDVMNEKVDSLEETYDTNLDITPNINDLRNTISSCKDPSYLSTLVA